MPGVPIHLNAAKPEFLQLQGNSLGVQLVRRRHKLNLLRQEAAVLLDAHPKTLMWWERDEREPADRFYPAIIRFLGYEPWPEPSNLAEALAAERRRRGLAVKTAAKILDVDEGTWLRWERGEWKPTSLKRPALDKFLSLNCASLFPDDVR